MDLLVHDLLCFLRKLKFLDFLSEILNFFIRSRSTTKTCSETIHEIFESPLGTARRYLGDNCSINIRIMAAPLFLEIIILLPNLVDLDIELVNDLPDASLQVVTLEQTLLVVPAVALKEGA